MTILKLQFAGKISKAEHRKAGDKPICEVSICKKVPARGQDAERFDWVRVTIWQPPEWAVQRLVKGNYISGSGDLALRPYEKEGVKKYNMEVRCNSFDFEVEELAERTADHAPDIAPAPRRPVAVAGASAGDDEPPFSRSDLEVSP
jgi:single-stranded DNA-binding protein